MKLYRLSAFPKTLDGGNKAGVVLDAEHLNDDEMQQIAAEVGYSETAFVTPGDTADFTVRFFTPTAEVDLCGHATIATFNLLRNIGRISEGTYTQQTKVGILQLRVAKDSVFMEQNLPTFGDVLQPDEIRDCFVEQNITDPTLPIQLVSTGLYEIFLPVTSVDILHQLTPNLDAITTLSKRYNVIGIHAFALGEDALAYGRNFAPIVGIDEESATGTSNGALACYLYKYVAQTNEMVLRQGYSMNQPSEIQIQLSLQQGVIQSVWVGGTARLLEKRDE